MNTFGERLKYFIDYKGLNNSRLEKIMGMSNGYIGKILAGYSKPSVEVLETLSNIYPEVNTDWLINNRGQMLLGETGLVQEPETSYSLKNANQNANLDANFGVPVVISVDSEGGSLVPFVGVKSRAGYLSGYGDPQFISTLPHYALPGMRNGRYIAFQIDGWSMYKEDIKEGLRDSEWIVCQAVENPQQVVNNRVYTIVTKDDGIITKRVLNRLKSQEDPCFICKSDNKSGLYPNIVVRPDQIQQIWELKLHLSTHITDPQDLFAKLAQIEGDYAILLDKIKRLEAERNTSN